MESDTKEIMSLMMRMRILIKKEFGVTPSLRDVDSAIKYYHMGTKSQQPELLQFAKQLGTLLSIPTAEAVAAIATPAEPVPQPALRESTPPAAQPIAQPIAPPTSQPIAQPIAPPTAQTMEQPIRDKPQPSNCFIELLASEQLRQPIKIIHPAIGSLIIDKQNRIYYTNATIQNIVLLEYASKDKIITEPIDLAGIRELYDEDQAARLSKLLWQCGLKMSHGELLSQLKPYEQFRFHRWPEFFMQPDRTKIAIFLSKNPHSVDDLVDQMDMSRHDAIAFLNASFLCGSLEGVADASAAPAAPQQGDANPERKSIISRIRSKLRNLT